MFFFVSVVAILDYCPFYCFGVFYFIFFEFLIPKNLCVDTRKNILSAFKKKVMSRHRFFMLVWRPSWISMHCIALMFFGQAFPT